MAKDIDRPCPWTSEELEVMNARAAVVRKGLMYETIVGWCERFGTENTLFAVATVLRDRAEATGSQRYELAAEDVRRAYDRRAGGLDDPEKGRAK